MFDQLGPWTDFVPGGIGAIGGIGIYHVFEGNRRLGWPLVAITTLVIAAAALEEILEWCGIMDH
jgi:hypothetical protein